MSRQRCSDKTVRRIRKQTGLDVVHAQAHHNHGTILCVSDGSVWDLYPDGSFARDDKATWRYEADSDYLCTMTGGTK